MNKKNTGSVISEPVIGKYQSLIPFLSFLLTHLVKAGCNYFHLGFGTTFIFILLCRLVVLKSCYFEIGDFVTICLSVHLSACCLYFCLILISYVSLSIFCLSSLCISRLQDNNLAPIDSFSLLFLKSTYPKLVGHLCELSSKQFRSSHSARFKRQDK